MKRSFLIAALAMLAMPATAQTVETGRSDDWDGYPPIKRSSARPLDVSFLSDWAYDILKTGKCKLPGQRAERFDIDVPYVALVEPNGTVKRIIVAETGCTPLNSMVGTTVFEMAKRGEFKPTGQDQPLWFSDRIQFARIGR